MDSNSDKKGDSLEEKFDRAMGVLLDQIRTNLKPSEALEQAQAIDHMQSARERNSNRSKDIPKK